MIGIVLADPNELKSIEWKIEKEETINQFKIYHFVINDKKVVLIFSGIGIVNAAAATQQLINSFKITKIINFGAVGGYGNDINVYDLIIPKRIYFHDVFTPWYPKGQTPGEKEWYDNLENNSNYNLASGNSFVSNIDDIKEINKNYNAAIFDMEAAAVFQIAHKNNLPCLAVKVISDIVGTNNIPVEDINTRIKNAGKKASIEVVKYI